MSSLFLQGERPLESAARTDTGRVRKLNEDRYVCDEERALFAVIDGMGGEQAGDVAAEITRDCLLSDDDLGEAILEANRRIFERGRETLDQQGMGCVVTAARLRGDQLRLAHVGDTRAYLVRETGCQLLTRDHTVVAEEQERLALTEAAARRLPDQHQVTRDVGGDESMDAACIDRDTVPFEPGDLLLLCSDGLHDLMPSSEIFPWLQDAHLDDRPAVEVAEALVQLALERGGRDNVTVVVVKRPARTDTVVVPDTAAPTGDDVVSGVARMARRLGPPTLVGVLAFLAGGLLWPGPSAEAPRELVPADVGLVAASQGFGLVLPGPAGLDGGLAPGPLVPLGRLEAAPGHQQTTVAAPRDFDPTASVPAEPVEIRGLELAFPVDGDHTWDITVEPGATLVLRQAAIRAPQTAVTIDLMGDGSAVLLVDSTVELASLDVFGAVEGALVVSGGLLVVGSTNLEPADRPVGLSLLAGDDDGEEP
jgi:serine/threonine protein phosphatase PrpC